MRGSPRGFRFWRTFFQGVVVVIVVCGLILQRRAMVFKERARVNAVLAEAQLLDVKPAPLNLDEYRRKWSDYHLEMSRLYKYAAAHPWLPLPPEPERPEPE